ncbi:iron ABC transporter permease [Austwickia sp. TVS 96-490-7B]|uniref:FecCD family ABC transporter permease n=1 Tax=Austwickia sp. TVS 96-490-7B TaxID=2830843 RepID=UPI0021051857|nr:iron ABC transporter permease [Austwickia sp. TVS 96-490-7B]
MSAQALAPPAPRWIDRPARLPLLCLALAVLLGVSIVTAIASGGADVSLSQTVHYLTQAITGGTIARDEVSSYQIIWQVRTPRVLLAALVGAALSATGAVIQAMVRNVLADPFLLGVSSGASVGAVSVTLAAVGMSSLGMGALASTLGVFFVTGGAFLGALGASALVWAASWQRDSGVTPVRLVLTGVVLAAGFQAIMSVLIYLVPDTESTSTVLFWSMGSFGAAAWALLPVVTVFVALGLVVYRRHASTLDVLSLGDETAASLGVDATAARRTLFVVLSLTTGAVTAVSGCIGFVGLVVPHIVRMLVGATHARVLAVAPLVGAILMVWVDLIARTLVAPRELPLSAITALIGVPVFIVLLRRRGHILGGHR